MSDPYDMRQNFKCKRAQCGHVFGHSLRELAEMDKVFCPKCGTSEDIRESKRSGEIFSLRRAADEIAKQGDEKD